MQNIKIVRRNPYAQIPQKGTPHAVGWDINACFFDQAQEEFKKNNSTITFEEFLSEYFIVLKPFETVALSTGLSVELPNNVEMAIKSRSGLFFKNSILAEGTIDPDYRGEIKIMLINLKNEPFKIQHGERIAQAIFRTVLNHNNLFVECSSVEDLSSTDRGVGGFGSTGIK